MSPDPGPAAPRSPGRPASPATPDELERRLRAIGDARYHHRHPFNVRMHDGRLGRDEIRAWVRNRYYYQTRIPVKDGLIVSKSGDAGFRREWVQRVHDHDGDRPGEGGLELWLQLADAVGLDRDEVERCDRVLPGVRRACDAYVEFVGGHDLLESVASSLTELFAGDIMHVRIAAFEKHYPWVETQGLRYFQSRTRQAPRDARFGLAYVKQHALTAEDQDRCCRALERKCEILWALLDAIETSFRRPRLTPGAELRDDDAEGPVVVLPERVVKLSPSAREILGRCDGERTCDEIARALRSREGQDPAVESDAHEFLAEMLRLGVVAG